MGFNGEMALVVRLSRRTSFQRLAPRGASPEMSNDTP
jgi:hypothetical protein